MTLRGRDNDRKINKQMHEKHINQISLIPERRDYNAKYDLKQHKTMKQGKTQHEMPLSENHKATQNNNTKNEHFGVAIIFAIVYLN